jgi:ubiquitin C
MKIHVKIITGQTLTLNVESNDSIEDVKQYIENHENGISKSLIKALFFNEINLNDAQFVSDYNIQDDSTLYIVTRL